MREMWRTTFEVVAAVDSRCWFLSEVWEKEGEWHPHARIIGRRENPRWRGRGVRIVWGRMVSMAVNIWWNIGIVRGRGNVRR